MFIKLNDIEETVVRLQNISVMRKDVKPGFGEEAPMSIISFMLNQSGHLQVGYANTESRDVDYARIKGTLTEYN